MDGGVNFSGAKFVSRVLTSQMLVGEVFSKIQIFFCRFASVCLLNLQPGWPASHFALFDKKDLVLMTSV